MKTKIIWLNDLIANKQKLKNQNNLNVPDHIPAPTAPKQTETRFDTENRLFYRKGGYHPVQIGDFFRNRYLVNRKLGWGNFSTVWLCWDKLALKFIALKILQSAPDVTIAALNEAQLLVRARTCKSDTSPQKIVQILDSFITTGVNGTHICMVFDVLGVNLLEVIKQSDYKGLPLTSVKSILRQVLAALDYLHTTCNIIHTDVKPENICLDVSRRAVNAAHELPVTLADLGNGCWVNRHFNSVIQTRPYRSPEVILGLDYQSNADVWSMACTAFELATGHYLFPLNLGFKDYSDDEHCLSLFTGLLGDVPESIAFASRCSRSFFTAEGKLLFVHGNLDSRGLFERLTERFMWDESEARGFSEFLLPMLAMDPNKRASARDCLGHKWLEF